MSGFLLVPFKVQLGWSLEALYLWYVFLILTVIASLIARYLHPKWDSRETQFQNMYRNFRLGVGAAILYYLLTWLLFTR